MHSPVDVTVVFLVVLPDRFHDLPGLLGGSGIIEIDKPAFIDPLAKYREVGADGIDREQGGRVFDLTIWRFGDFRGSENTKYF
jgi:hypothetical protein